jgi:MFS family permease
MQRYREQVHAFSRDAWLFLLASLVLSTGGAASAAFTTLYYRLAGFDPEFLGWIASAFPIGAAAGTLPALMLVDRLGRRLSMICGATVSLLSWGLAVLLATHTSVLLLLFVGGAGNALFALSVIPLLAQVSTSYERMTLFTFRDGVVTFGMLIGGVVAGFGPGLASAWLGHESGSLESYRAVLLASVVWRLMALIPLLLVKGKPADPKEAGNPDSGKSLRQFLSPKRLLSLSTPVLFVTLPVSVISFATSLVQPFLALYLRDVHLASDRVIAATLALSSFTVGVAAFTAPLLLLRISRRSLIVIATAAAGLSMILLVDAWSLQVAVFGLLLRAAAISLAVPVFRAAVIDAATPRDHTVIALMLSAGENVGEITAPPIAGRILTNGGYYGIFTSAAAAFAAGAMLFVWASRRIAFVSRPRDQ